MGFRPDDLTDLLTAAPAGPAQPMSYRQGVITAWNPLTLENTVIVGGATLTNLPVLGIAEVATYQPGDVVGLMVVGSTWAIIGQLVVPNTPQALSALSFLSSRVYAANVSAAETCTSTTYTDLATVGPQLSNVLIGPSGRCLIAMSTNIIAGDTGATGQEGGLMTYTMSGPTNVAATDSIALQESFVWGQAGASFSQTFTPSFTRETVQEGLTAGLYTITAKYRCVSTQADFRDRTLRVIAL